VGRETLTVDTSRDITQADGAFCLVFDRSMIGVLAPSLWNLRRAMCLTSRSKDQPSDKVGGVLVYMSECLAMRWRCDRRRSVSGVRSWPVRRGRGSAAAIAPRRVRSLSLIAGRLIWRRRTVSWCRSTMISSSLDD